MTRRCFAAFVLALIASAAPARANLILNGSFETGIDLSSGPGIAIVNNGDIADWTLSPTTNFAWYMSSGVGYGVAEDGSRFVNLTSHSISQSFAVTAGDLYTVSYYEALRGDGGGQPDTVATSISLAAGGATGITSQIANNPLANATVADYVLFTFAFLPDTSTTATLTFALNNGAGYPVIDNVVVTGVAVPEPASLLLLGLGAAGLFIAARRRRRA